MNETGDVNRGPEAEESIVEGNPRHEEMVRRFGQEGIGEKPVTEKPGFALKDQQGIEEIRSTFNSPVETSEGKQARQIREGDKDVAREITRNKVRREAERNKKGIIRAAVLTPLITIGSFIAVHIGLDRQEKIDDQKEARYEQAVFTDQQNNMSQQVHVGEGGNVTEVTASDGTAYSNEAANQESDQGN